MILDKVIIIDKMDQIFYEKKNWNKDIQVISHVTEKLTKFLSSVEDYLIMCSRKNLLTKC